jgi:signal transduction histidine kinase
MWESKSVAFASLRVGNESYGVLAVDYVEERHVFTPSEARLLDAVARAAGAALAQARLRETLEARLRAIEAMHRLSDVVVRTSDLKAVLISLNSGVCRQIGVECLRVTFSDPILTSLLRLKRPNQEENALLRVWRSGEAAERQAVNGSMAIPVPIAGRTAGVLWMRVPADLDPGMIEFAEAIASGLGEVAFKAKLRRTAERRNQELAVAGERERIARDLHDTVGQTFYGIGLKLQEIMADVPDENLLGKLAHLRSLAARAVYDVRSAVYALSFLHVRATGLVPSLRELVEQFGRATGVTAEFRIERGVPRLSREAQSALFRMAHEALVNVERHARATGVIVTLAAMDGTVELSIRDDGVGLDQRQAADWQSAAHFGMRTMARAVEQAGGYFSVAPASPRGLLIRGVIPMKPIKRKREQ